MKFDFKIDFISRTAAHFTTFAQPAQSQAIIDRNLHDLDDRARQVKSEIGLRARDKALGQMKGGNVDAFG